MKFEIMLGILFTLLSNRKVSAGDLAKKFNCSVRSIYRYVDELTVAHIPIDITRGSKGGIQISDAYKLPKGLLTREEYARAIEAMLAMNVQLTDPVLQSAIEKLSAQSKTEKFDVSLSGNILVDSGTWGSERKFSERLSLMERAIEEREALEIDYVDRGGEHTHRTILPHLLVYKQNIWYVYAYCRKREEFRLFKLGRMRTVIRTGDKFVKQPFSREDVPLTFWNGERTVNARFEISAEALPFAEEWLGIENIFSLDGKYVADITLPDDESLVGKILSAGAGFRVLSPGSLAERVQAQARRIAEAY